MRVKPIKTILVGILLTLAFSLAAGVPLMMLFANSWSTDFKETLDANTYSSIQLFVNFFSILLSVYLATKNSPNKEIKFGIIIGLFFALLQVPWNLHESLKVAPIWYIILSIPLPVIAGILGGYNRMKLHKESKICPKCAEQIKAEALICRYCGHSFEASFSPPQ